MVKRFISRIIDWFYLPFIRRIVPYVTFRYAACGSITLFVDWVVFAFIYNFVLEKQNVELGIITISSYIAAFMITFPVTFFTGFWLNNNIAFEHSPLGDRTKMFRYLMVVCANILLKYFGLKLLVGVLGIYPTPSNIAISLISVVFSYLAQRYFTFKS